MTIKLLLLEHKAQKVNEIKGWVVSNRGNKAIRFVMFNDGSTFDSLQVVLKDENAANFDKVLPGSAVSFSGQIKLTPEAPQPIELQATIAAVLSAASEDYPIQRQEMNRETLRELPHVRHRTHLFRAIMRVRSTLLQEIHAWFAEHNFLNVASPIITGIDGEGAGEAFIVNDKKQAFFSREATLGVTGQLHAEAFATGFYNVYTFAPTFRAEYSHTQRHAAEFWMIEPEMAFTSQIEAIRIAEKLLKDTIRATLAKLAPEFTFLEEHFQKNHKVSLKAKLDAFLNTGIQILDYKDAIKTLQKVKNRFEVKTIEFGTDLATEHERYLAEEFIHGPVAITNYPKKIKAFYMKQNADHKTVACFDVLVPGIGELIGGSQRETDLTKLEARMKELKISTNDLQWYLDLRRYGDYMSSGFGIGFERLIMFVTGIENIRDVIPFPRTSGTLLM